MEEPRSQEREATAEDRTTGQKANLKTAQPACVRHGGKEGRPEGTTSELREGRKETWTGTCPSQTLIEGIKAGLDAPMVSCLLLLGASHSKVIILG